MKEVTVTAWCDGPAHHLDPDTTATEERVPATVERTVGFERRKPIVLDLCADCDNLLLRYVDAGIAVDKTTPPTPSKRRSHSTAPPPPDGEGFGCEECGRAFASLQGLRMHQRRTHRDAA